MTILVNPAEVRLTAIRAQGPGGQNVNKVSCAVHLRFDIGASSLPDYIKARLQALADQRVNQDGVVVLKAQKSRSLEQNKDDAVKRLQGLVDSVATLAPARRATRPTRSSQRKRLDAKTRAGQTKALRAKIE